MLLTRLGLHSNSSFIYCQTELQTLHRTARLQHILRRAMATDQPLSALKGEFIRPVSNFRNWITKDGSTGFMAESGRYHLYVANNCPWAHRTIVTRRYKGLENVITMDTVDRWRDIEKGWRFDPTVPGTTSDSVNGCKFIQEIYFLANKDYTGRFSVPVLWDKKTKTIVNNESSEILRMLNSEFNEFCESDEQRALDLYPENLRKEIDSLNEWIYPFINNGVYRAGFAKTQEAYDVAVREVFEGLDRVENILSKQRYLTGPTLTEADVRLFTTLIRFDVAYHIAFKCSKKRIVDYPNIWGYLRDLFQTTGFGETTNFNHITQGYFRNRQGETIVPIRPDIDYNQSHGRELRFSS